jgi:O-methyltransferase
MTLLRRIHRYPLKRRLTKLVLPHTLVGLERIDSLYALVQRIDDERIPGDVVECGVYKGGTAAILARIATRSRLGRLVWLFDSFKGMPEISEEDGADAREYVGQLVSSPRQVEELLRRAGADLSRGRIVPGFFQDTFPTIQIPSIALLNIDADWYDSVKLCLDEFYDCIQPGGIVSIDDYGHWQGCRQAVEEFFQTRRLTYELQTVDYSARWFRKS